MFDFVERLLLRRTPMHRPEDCLERDRFIGKLQQITSPVAAKGVEDTVLYVYNRLLSLNEVGSDPTRFGIEPAAVHDWMAARAGKWPAALSATSTHDTKRGEDVRARLNVLSEIPGAWKGAVTRWRAINRRFKVDLGGLTAPDSNEEYFIYQTLVGAWPFDPQEEPALQDRLKAYLVKALREAKVHTSWLRPNELYESAVLQFLQSILDRRRPFLEPFKSFQARVAELGIYNSLAQLLIKITAPGVPDFYQGTELWDLTLVDPDNRRPVDYQRCRSLRSELDRCPNPAELTQALLERRSDGRVKLMAMVRALEVRSSFADLFRRGDYLPLRVAGSKEDHLFAFARVLEGRAIITCVPRLIATLLSGIERPPVGRDIWSDTAVNLDALPGARTFRDAFTGAVVSADNHRLEAASIFDQFPVALLVPHA
jgi:(1->4)-alpha-D-glucan 1-alpha-D-glucosylmutase